MTVEALTPPLSVMVDKTTSFQRAQHENQAKKTESTEEQLACKATEATTKAAKAEFKVAAKTSQQAQADQASEAVTISVSMG